MSDFIKMNSIAPFWAFHSGAQVGWDPEWSQEPQTLMFKPSTFEFSSNAFAYRGLRILSALANATTGGSTGAAAAYEASGIRYEQQAQALRGNMMANMWNESAQHGAGGFCDGVCADPLVQTNTSGGFGGIYTHMYALYLGLSPPEAAPATWSYVADWGLERLGDWGAYALQSALSDFDEGWGEGESGNVEANGGGKGLGSSTQGGKARRGSRFAKPGRAF